LRRFSSVKNFVAFTLSSSFCYHFPVAVARAIEAKSAAVKYWEIIADNLSKAGWSLGWVSAFDSEGRISWIVDAHRDVGKRYVVRADEILTVYFRD